MKKVDHDRTLFLLSYREYDVKLIRFDANNVDKKQQQKFIDVHQLNCQIDCGSVDVLQAINMSR